MISLKSSAELGKMRVAGKVAADALSYLDTIVKPGISTLEVDKKLEEFIRANGCLPATLGYHGYEFSCCASVNEQIVHCTPSERILNDGDIVTIDTGAIFEGFYSDTAKTFLVGEVTPQVKFFVENGYQALIAGIHQVKEGNKIIDISRAVSTVITAGGYGIVKEFVGHGIGAALHEDPQIPNYVHPKATAELTIGMAVAIEPITTMQNPSEVFKKSEWEIVTKSGDWSAHWEHTIALTENGYEVLTKRQDECL